MGRLGSRLRGDSQEAHWRPAGRPRRLGGRLASGLAIWALLAAQSHAVTLPSMPSLHPEEQRAAIAVCATERETLVEREKEYSDLRRARLNAALTADAKAGLLMLMSTNPLFAVAAAAAKRAGVLGPQTGGAPGGASGPGGGGQPGGGGLVGSFLGGGANGQAAVDTNAMMAEALNTKVPGVPLALTTATATDKDARALLAISVMAAADGNLDLYVKIKQQQFGSDIHRMVASIEDDAATQAPVAADTAAQVKVLAECRTRQVTDFRAKLGAAANDKDRKQLTRAQAGVKSAVGADLDMSQDLADEYSTEARVFTQARAMAESKSEADVLGDQTPAYAGAASRTPLKLVAVAGAAPEPPPKPTYVTTRPTIARSAPSAKASVVMNLPAGRTVVSSGHSAQDLSWWQIDLAGTPAFVPGSDLADPGAAPVVADPAPAPTTGKKGRGKGHNAPPPPPAAPPPPPPPSAIQTLNRHAIAARNDGVEKLRVLSVQIQPAAREGAAPGA